MVSTPMRQLVKLPFGLLVFWASPWDRGARFSYPGIHVWIPWLQNNLRILPLPRCYDLSIFRYGKINCWACGGYLHKGWPRLWHALTRWHRATIGTGGRVLTEQEQERIRQAVYNNPELMAGVQEGLAAYERGDPGRPWSEVKKELGIK